MTATPTKLLPCPFCGGAADTDRWRGVPIAYISCRKCGVNVRGDGKSIKACVIEAAERWNTRAATLAPGWVMVPREPTEAQLASAIAAWQKRIAARVAAGTLLDGGNAEQSMRETYAAMLTAIGER